MADPTQWNDKAPSVQPHHLQRAVVVTVPLNRREMWTTRKKIIVGSGALIGTAIIIGVITRMLRRPTLTSTTTTTTKTTTVTISSSSSPNIPLVLTTEIIESAELAAERERKKEATREMVADILRNTREGELVAVETKLEADLLEQKLARQRARRAEEYIATHAKRIEAGRALIPGVILVSDNGEFAARQLHGGALEVYRVSDGAIMYRTEHRPSTGSAQTVLWSDGRLCTYNGTGQVADPALWCADSQLGSADEIQRLGALFFKVSDDGRLVIRGDSMPLSSPPIWSTPVAIGPVFRSVTAKKSTSTKPSAIRGSSKTRDVQNGSVEIVSRVEAGQPLTPNLALTSRNRAFVARQSSNGQLYVLQRNNQLVVFQTPARLVDSSGARTVLWPDGTISTYKGLSGPVANPPLWSTSVIATDLLAKAPGGDITKFGPLYLELTDDGVLAVRGDKMLSTMPSFPLRTLIV